MNEVIAATVLVLLGLSAVAAMAGAVTTREANRAAKRGDVREAMSLADLGSRAWGICLAALAFAALGFVYLGNHTYL